MADQVNLSTALRQALSASDTLVDIQALSADGQNLLRLVTNAAGDIASTLTKYVRTAETWPSGARVMVSAIVGKGEPEMVFLDVVLRRQRLTPTGGLQRVWVNGPGMPEGDAP